MGKNRLTAIVVDFLRENRKVSGIAPDKSATQISKIGFQPFRRTTFETKRKTNCFVFLII